MGSIECVWEKVVMFTVVKPYKIDEIIINSTQRSAPSERNTDSHDVSSNPLPSARLQPYSFGINITCRCCQETKNMGRNFVRKEQSLKRSCVIAKGSCWLSGIQEGRSVTPVKSWVA